MANPLRVMAPMSYWILEDFKLKVDQQIETDPENKDKSKTPKQCEGTLLELF